jgi:hypothetical protein
VLRGPELNRGLKVMSLARYLFSTPRIEAISFAKPNEYSIFLRPGKENIENKLKYAIFFVIADVRSLRRQRSVKEYASIFLSSLADVAQLVRAGVS